MASKGIKQQPVGLQVMVHGTVPTGGLPNSGFDSCCAHPCTPSSTCSCPASHRRRRLVICCLCLLVRAGPTGRLWCRGLAFGECSCWPCLLAAAYRRAVQALACPARPLLSPRQCLLSWEHWDMQQTSANRCYIALLGCSAFLHLSQNTWGAVLSDRR